MEPLIAPTVLAEAVLKKIDKLLKEDPCEVLKRKPYIGPDGKEQFRLFKVKTAVGVQWVGVAPLKITRVPRMEEAQAMGSTDGTTIKKSFLEVTDQFLTGVNNMPLLAVTLGDGDVVRVFYAAVARGVDVNEVVNELTNRLGALEGALIGTFSQIEFTSPSVEEMNQLFEIPTCYYVVAMSGVPSRTGLASEDHSRPVDIEQREVLLRGGLGSKYRFITVAEPIKKTTLLKALDMLSEAATDAKSNIEGQDVWSAGISFPMMGAFAQGQTHANTISGAHAISLQDARTHGVNHSISETVGTSHTVSESQGRGISDQVSSQVEQNLGVAHGVSAQRGVTVSDSRAHGTNYSFAENWGQTAQHSTNYQVSEQIGEAHSRTLSEMHGQALSEQHGVSAQVSDGYTLSSTHGVNQQWGTSQSQSLGYNESLNVQRGVGDTFTVSHGHSDTSTLGGEQSTSLNVGQQRSVAEQFSTSLGQQQNYGENMGYGVSRGSSSNWADVISQQQNYGANYTRSTGENTQSGYGGYAGVAGSWGETDSLGSSHSNLWSHTSGWNVSGGIGAGGGGGSTPLAGGGSSQDPTTGAWLGGGYSDSTTQGQTDGFSSGRAVSDGFTASQGVNWNNAYGQSWGDAYGNSASVSSGVSHSSGGALNYGEQQNYGYNWGYGMSQTDTAGRTNTVGDSVGVGRSVGSNYSYGQSDQVGESMGRSMNYTEGQTLGSSVGYQSGSQYGMGVSDQAGVARSVGTQLGRSDVMGVTDSYQQGASVGDTYSRQYGVSQGYSDSVGTQRGYSNQYGASDVRTTGIAQSETNGVQDTYSQGSGYSKGESRGSQLNWVNGTADGVTQTLGRSDGISDSTSLSRGLSDTIGYATTTGSSTSTSISGGIAPFLSLGKTKRTFDVEFFRLSEYLEIVRKRFEKAIGEGGWQVSNVLVTPTRRSVERMMATIRAAFNAPQSRPNPIEYQLIDYKPLAEHIFMKALLGETSLLERLDGWEGLYGLDKYEFITTLGSYELTSLVHMPREEFPGLDVQMENIPKCFRSPSTTPGEVFIGWVYETQRGRVTEQKLNLRVVDPVTHSPMIGHLLVNGATGYGKSNAVMQIAAQMATAKIYGEGENAKGLKVIILDWKNSHRKLLTLPALKDKLLMFTLNDMDVAPFFWNPLRPMVIEYNVDSSKRKVVDPYDWAEMFAEQFASCFVASERAKSIIFEEITNLYTKNGVFKNHGHPNWGNYPTLLDLHEAIHNRKEAVRNQSARTSQGELESLSAIESRLIYFTMGRLAEMYSERKVGIPIEELFTSEANVILEAGFLHGSIKKFLLGLFAIACHAYHRKARVRDIPLFMVFEEAHQIIPQESRVKEMNIEESIFETMFREDREYNLFFAAVSQIMTQLPLKIQENTPWKIILNTVTTNEGDTDVITEQLVRDPRYRNPNFKRFIGRMTRGMAIVKLPYARTLQEHEPVLVQIPYAPLSSPTDDDLHKFMQPIIDRLKRLREPNTGSGESTVVSDNAS